MESWAVQTMYTSLSFWLRSFSRDASQRRLLQNSIFAKRLITNRNSFSPTALSFLRMYFYKNDVYRGCCLNFCCEESCKFTRTKLQMGYQAYVQTSFFVDMSSCANLCPFLLIWPQKGYIVGPFLRHQLTSRKFRNFICIKSKDISLHSLQSLKDTSSL